MDALAPILKVRPPKPGEAEHILTRLARGHFLTSIVDGMPGLDIVTVSEWVDSDTPLGVRLRRARATGLESRAEAAVNAALDESIDVGRARVNLDATRWYLQHNKPDKYAPKADINVNGTVQIAGALARAAARVQHEAIPEAERLDEPTTYDVASTDTESDDVRTVDDLLS